MIPVIANSVVVAIGKGGSSKTAIATSLAAIWAAEHHHRVLLVDLDNSANATTAVGIDPRDYGNGQHLADAILTGAGLAVVTTRDHLDVVVGGHALKELSRHLIRHDIATSAFGDVFAAVGNDYSRIVFDLPPSGFSRLNDDALICGEHLLVPTSAHSVDDREGLAVLADELAEIGSTIHLLGVVLARVKATANHGAKRAAVQEALAGDARVLQTIIREADSAYGQARDAGVLLHEYGQWAAQIKSELSVTEQIEAKISVPQNTSHIVAELYELAEEVEDLIDRHATTKGTP